MGIFKIGYLDNVLNALHHAINVQDWEEECAQIVERIIYCLWGNVQKNVLTDFMQKMKNCANYAKLGAL